MTNYDIERLEQHLRKLANQSLLSDDEEFNPQDYAGGNYDDAYNMGVQDGEVLFARELLRDYFPYYND